MIRFVAQLIDEMEGKKENLNDILNELDEETDEFPRFKDLHWRLEVVTDSRAIKSINKPRILMQFKFDQANRNQSFKYLVTDAPNLFTFKENIQDALLESNSNQILKLIRFIK